MQLNIEKKNLADPILPQKKENPEYKKIFDLIADTAQHLKFPAFVIGGYVRDRLLGRPSKDVDVVCVGSGINLAENLSQKISPPPDLAVFKNFGTAMIKVKDLEIEFVGARKESYRSDSRKPVVEDGTFEDDLKRRDFTINALAVSLNPVDKGKLIDAFNGLDDLQHRIIKTPLDPGQTFSDDPLRMMRAIRFAAQLDFTIEQNTYEAIRYNKDRIEIISRERISDELNKIILAEKPSIGFKLLYHTGLLDIIFPELTKLQGVDIREGIAHKDNFYHTLQVLDNVAEKSNDLWLRWSAILHDIGKPRSKRFDKKQGWTFHGHDAIGARMVPKIFRRMKLPMNEKMQFVKKLVALHLRPIGLNKHNVTDSAIRRLIFDAGNDLDKLMQLCEADITSKNKSKVKKYLENFEIVRQKIKDVEERDKIRNFQPPVSGDEIIKAFNMKPGPKIGIIKNAIKEAILEGEIRNDKEEAYQFMLKKGEELGLEPQNKRS